MTTKNSSRYAITNPNLRQPFSDFGHHNQQATDARMPCGTRTSTFNHSGQLEKFVTLGDCNATLYNWRNIPITLTIPSESRKTLPFGVLSEIA